MYQRLVKKIMSTPFIQIICANTQTYSYSTFRFQMLSRRTFIVDNQMTMVPLLCGTTYEISDYLAEDIYNHINHTRMVFRLGMSTCVFRLHQRNDGLKLQYQCGHKTTQTGTLRTRWFLLAAPVIRNNNLICK